MDKSLSKWIISYFFNQYDIIKIGGSMKNLSKSRYVQGVTCKKKCWLSIYKPEEAKEVTNKSVFENELSDRYVLNAPNYSKKAKS